LLSYVSSWKIFVETSNEWLTLWLHRKNFFWIDLANNISICYVGKGYMFCVHKRNNILPKVLGPLVAFVVITHFFQVMKGCSGGRRPRYICYWVVEVLEIIRQLQPLFIKSFKKIRISIGIWNHIILNSWSHYIGHGIEITDCLSMPIKNKLIVL